MKLPNHWGADECARARRVLDAFATRFGAPAPVLAWAPGRVNLLGEHTDYNGLPVLPLAIDRSIMIAAATDPSARVRLENLDPSFSARVYEIAPPIAPFADGDWGNYHKAAVKGVMTHLGGQRPWCGGRFTTDGNIPAGAGLSSSSAFVVASALAFLAVNDREIAAAELAELLPRAERYVGTLSGGMDQAASLLSQAGHALRIDFFPLRVRPVPLPAGIAVVVCDSLVRAEKARGARDAYNRRVIECRLACRVLSHALGAVPLSRLGDLVERYPERALASFVSVLAGAVADRPLALAEIAALVGVAVADLRSDIALPAGMSDGFNLLRRARHVLTEAERVNEAEGCLADGDLVRFGALMRASHASCRDDYEVSCAELDALVECANRAGALGARLTGAGFGGCTVNLVRVADLDSFLAAIDRDFYRPRLGADAPQRHRFVLTARGGAGVVRAGG